MFVKVLVNAKVLVPLFLFHFLFFSLGRKPNGLGEVVELLDILNQLILVAFLVKQACHSCLQLLNNLDYSENIKTPLKFFATYLIELFVRSFIRRVTENLGSVQLNFGVPSPLGFALNVELSNLLRYPFLVVDHVCQNFEENVNATVQPASIGKNIKPGSCL